MSSIVNYVLFVDSHVEGSLKLLFQVLEDIIGVRQSRKVPGCPLIVFAFQLQESRQLEPEEGDSESPVTAHNLQGPPGVNVCVMSEHNCVLYLINTPTNTRIFI